MGRPAAVLTKSVAVSKKSCVTNSWPQFATSKSLALTKNVSIVTPSSNAKDAVPTGKQPQNMPGCREVSVSEPASPAKSSPTTTKVREVKDAGPDGPFIL